MFANHSKMTDKERQVDAFLKELGIEPVFEYPVFLRDEKGRPRLWTPDFYLPDLNVYVEVCGSKSFDYDYRRERYRDNNIDVVFLHLYREEAKWQEHFKKQLAVFVKKRLSTLKQMMEVALP